MDFEDLMARFAVALGIGLLIGLERGWRMREESAGSRTTAFARLPFPVCSAAQPVHWDWHSAASPIRAVASCSG